MKDNQTLSALIEKLMREKKPIWKKVAQELSKPRRRKAEVNLSKIEQYAEEGVTVLVPGKVLGSGPFKKKLTIAAFSFSGSARKLISQSGGSAISIESLCQSNPEGKDILILK